jgi:hypothetical protein
MRARSFFAVAALAAIIGSAEAQERRATFGESARPGEGKCTVDVVVDGAVEIEIRGDRAVMRNLSGTPPQWRRFICTGPLPANPDNFRFDPQEGRGRQELIRDPRRGGAAVVRIEDRSGGREGYKFDIYWSGYTGAIPPDRGFGRGPDRDGGRDFDRDRDRGDRDGYYRDRDDWFRRGDWRQRLFERVRMDVEHVRSVTFPIGADQYRLAETIRQLDQLQDLLARGRYDRRELDDVIEALQRVLRDNRLSRRDRDVLADDVDRLRDFRARYRDYGVR